MAAILELDEHCTKNFKIFEAAPQAGRTPRAPPFTPLGCLPPAAPPGRPPPPQLPPPPHQADPPRPPRRTSPMLSPSLPPEQEARGVPAKKPAPDYFL